MLEFWNWGDFRVFKIEKICKKYLFLYNKYILNINKNIMAIISVEVPEEIAKKVKYNVISLEELYTYDDKYHSNIVDFGEKWVWKDEFMEYLSNK